MVEYKLLYSKDTKQVHLNDAAKEGFVLKFCTPSFADAWDGRDRFYYVMEREVLEPTQG